MSFSLVWVEAELDPPMAGTATTTGLLVARAPTPTATLPSATFAFTLEAVLLLMNEFMQLLPSPGFVLGYQSGFSTKYLLPQFGKPRMTMCPIGTQGIVISSEPSLDDSFWCDDLDACRRQFLEDDSQNSLAVVHIPLINSNGDNIAHADVGNCFLPDLEH